MAAEHNYLIKLSDVFLVGNFVEEEEDPMGWHLIDCYHPGFEKSN